MSNKLLLLLSLRKKANYNKSFTPQNNKLNHLNKINNIVKKYIDSEIYNDVSSLSLSQSLYVTIIINLDISKNLSVDLYSNVIDTSGNIIDVSNNYIDSFGNYIDMSSNYIDFSGNYIDFSGNYIDSSNTICDIIIVEPVEVPVEVPVEAPVEVPVEAPVEVPVEALIEVPIEVYSNT